MENIEVWGVCMYNLKDISLIIFCDKLIVIIGLFGLGKLFLVFDMFYVEG